MLRRLNLVALWALLALNLVISLAPRAEAGAIIPVSWAKLAGQVAGMTQLTGAGSATDDDFPVYDTSAGALKRISRSELATVFSGGAAACVGCDLYKAAQQTVSASTWTAIEWDGENYDSGSLHSTVSNTTRVVLPSTGKYLVLTTTCLANLGDMRFYLNGSGVYGNLAGAASSQYNSVGFAIISATANDYLEEYVYTSSTAIYATSPNWQATGTRNDTKLSVIYLGS